MTVAINLTPIIITTIICITLVILGNMGAKNKQKKQKEIQVPEFMFTGKRHHADQADGLRYAVEAQRAAEEGEGVANHE